MVGSARAVVERRASALALVAQEALDLGRQLVARPQLDLTDLGTVVGRRVVGPPAASDWAASAASAASYRRSNCETMARCSSFPSTSWSRRSRWRTDSRRRSLPGTLTPVAVVSPSSRATDAAGYDIDDT